MDKINIFTENTDINIIKSWLIGCSDGQIYPINDRFLPRIRGIEFNDRIEEQWDNIMGSKYDYKIDDPNLEKVANDILNNINRFIENVNKDPQKYLGDVKKKKYVVHMSAVVDNTIEGYFDSEEEATNSAMSRGRSLLYDKCLDGVDDEWHWDGNINVEGVETV